MEFSTLNKNAIHALAQNSLEKSIGTPLIGASLCWHPWIINSTQGGGGGAELLGKKENKGIHAPAGHKKNFYVNLI